MRLQALLRAPVRPGITESGRDSDPDRQRLGALAGRSL